MEHMINGHDVTERDYNTWLNMSPEMRVLWEKQQGFSVAKSVILGTEFNFVADEPDVVAPPEYTGGSVGYYSIEVTHPTTEGRPPYIAECNDIIEALNLNYAEGNVIKAIWRRAAAEIGKCKAGYKDGLYDAEKVEFFGHRLVVQESK